MRFGLIAFTFALLMSQQAFAEATEAHLTLKDKVFTPSEITVPAGQKVTLFIKNEDSAAAEFESPQLHREKVIPAGKEISVNLSPMAAGSYTFHNDFHRASTGTIIAK